MAKALKEQNNIALWTAVAVNALLFYGLLNATAISVEGISALARRAVTIAPIGIAGIIITVLNGLIKADFKATLVFWRLKHALPGQRAFSIYAQKDTRIDPQRLKAMFRGKLPSDPAEQNAAWYKLYRTVRDDVIIVSSHKLFLLLRGFTALSVMFTLVLGPWGLISIANHPIGAAYFAVLVLQYLLVRQSAANAGARLVTNVLALKTSTTR